MRRIESGGAGMAPKDSKGTSLLATSAPLWLRWGRMLEATVVQFSLWRWVAVLLAWGSTLGWAQVVRMPLQDTPPFSWSDANGRPQGIYPAMAAALARITGLDIRVEVVPFARAASLVASGQGDATLLFATAFTEGRAREAAVAFYTQQVVLMRPGLKVPGRADLAPLALARMNGGCRDLAEDTRVPWRFEELSSQEAGVKMLLAGRIDGFCSVNESLSYAILGVGGAAQLDGAQRVVLASRPVWLLLSPQMDERTETRLVQGLRQLQKSEEIHRIFRAQLGPHYLLNLPK